MVNPLSLCCYHSSANNDSCNIEKFYNLKIQVYFVKESDFLFFILYQTVKTVANQLRPTGLGQAWCLPGSSR